MDVTYDFPGIRTVRGAALLLAVYHALMLALVLAAGATSGRPPLDLLPILIYIHSIPLAVTIKTLTVLSALEREGRSQPDRAMEYLFTLAVLLPPTVGLIPVLVFLKLLY
jgi:hypothetical protein